MGEGRSPKIARSAREEGDDFAVVPHKSAAMNCYPKEARSLAKALIAVNRLICF